MKLFLCGDVMTGRGLDQILPYPSDPVLFESFVRDAREYVRLAASASGEIPLSVPASYIWGEAMDELDRQRPDLCIVNLETSVTTASAAWPKGINYRMHPANIGCLTVAGIDCCVLANNHLLDWGRPGPIETLSVLSNAGMRGVGAGPDAAAAARPAAFAGRGGVRVLVFAAATADSGVPPDWIAQGSRSGIHRLEELSPDTLDRETERIAAERRPKDIILYSVHWGGNWGFAVSDAQQRFARGLVDQAGVDLVHGHSSHHVKGFEIHSERLILYGCGDFITDYEGIGGHEAFRGELGLMYFPVLESATGRLLALEMVPTRVRRFRVERASGADLDWLAATLGRECGRFDIAVERRSDGNLMAKPRR